MLPPGSRSTMPFTNKRCQHHAIENSTVHFDSWTSIYHNNCLIQNDNNFTQDQQSMHKSSSVVQAWPGTTGPQANIVTHIDHDFVLAHTPGVCNGVCQSQSPSQGMFTHKEVPAASSAAQQWEVQHQDGQAAQDCKPNATQQSFAAGV